MIPGLGKSVGDDRVRRGIKRHPDVRARNFEVRLYLACHAIPPIHNTVVPGVNRRLHHRIRKIAAQGVDEVAGALPGIAIGKHTPTVFLEDADADRVGCLTNGLVGDGAAEG